ncbi:kinase-like protein [Stereum hirsutum FP-91666 SS1]|uniref:kinase-like protein n=1 Tax=Stereum hirsutum (strain FP-91666) TaxID=721885 RepID=UPI000444A1EF|nr:kinase-like protein [Stereum hirsutum FP-91666 SS1]EIM82678.1 kinase-like protein [Stereum hirsutum FP-91666 SS1]
MSSGSPSPPLPLRVNTEYPVFDDDDALDSEESSKPSTPTSISGFKRRASSSASRLKNVATRFKARVSESRRRLSSSGRQEDRVVKIGDTIMRKHRVLPSEVAAMQYVARHTTIPVPKVLEVTQSEFAGGLGMTLDMEYVDGYEMQYAPEKDWPGLLEELKGYVRQMRSLEPPRPGRVESIDGSRMRDVGISSNKAIGPFDSIHAFHDHLGFGQARAVESRRNDWPLLDKIIHRAHQGGYRTVFTHGDIAPRNVLVKSGKIVALIDWENAGWCPEWWEAIGWNRGIYNELPESWLEARNEVVGSYPEELAGYAAVCRVFPKY